MKTIRMIAIAAAFCAPALASAQRGGGGAAISIPRVSVQRTEVQRVQRVDPGRPFAPTRDVDIRRGNVFGGDTGTRIRRRDDDPDRRRPHDPARRRWNAAHPSDPDPSDTARRRWNAAHPSDPDPSRDPAGR